METLREAFDYPFSRLDPFGAHIDPPSVAIYETVVVKGPDADPHPYLAASWTISPDGHEWTFRLRPNLRFHSGARCDAAGVAAALHRLRWGFYEDRQSWYWDPVDRVEVESQDTLRFRLHHPCPNLPSLLWGTHTAIFNEDLRAREPEAFGDRLADGTGPFRLTSWSPEHVVAERWAEYPGAPAKFLGSTGSAKVEAVEWIAITDEVERLTALEEGRIHCLHGPVPSEIERLEGDSRFRVFRHGQRSNFYLGLNWSATELGFDDLKVRHAISLAIDREGLVQAAVGGHGRGTWGPLPEWDPMYESAVDAGRKKDAVQADRLLNEAGWVRSAGGVREKAGQRLEFECVIQDDDVHRRLGYALAGQLGHIGISLLPRPVQPFKEFYSAVEAGPASFINKWLWQDAMDAIIGFSASWCRPFPNAQKSSVPELDAAYHAWVRATSHQEMKEAASRAQHVVADRLPYIPLLTPDDVWVVDRRVHGYQPYPATLYPFYHSVWIEH
jgi:peptide/nickel transport system substrate-binding protein